MDFTLQIINNSTLSLSVFDESSESVSVSTEILTLEVLGGSDDTTLEIASQPFTTIQGPVGPRGPAGSSVGFEHVQNSPANSWIINHNLGFNPSVTVSTLGGVEVTADVIHVSANQFIVNFSQDFAGKVIAR